MKRTIIIALAGVLVIGGASAAALVEVDCTQCETGIVECDECRNLVRCSHCEPISYISGFIVGDPSCPVCGGRGTLVRSTGSIVHSYDVECGCRGADAECRVCRGTGTYPSRTTGLCETCDGKGGSACPICEGSTSVKANQVFLRALRPG